MGINAEWQLNPPISVEVIGRGPALAVGAIGAGACHELVWVVIAKVDGAITAEPISKLRGAGLRDGAGEGVDFPINSRKSISRLWVCSLKNAGKIGVE